MAEETVPVPVEAEKMEETAEPSTSAEPVEGGEDVDNEAKKLMGAGRRHLVMKDIRAAVNAFQEACSLLGKKYGETADECADAFFSYGMALLELARMENGVLGNALEGMPEDEEEDGEKEEDPNIPSAANLDEKEREQLREQVYDAMAEKEKSEKSDAEEPKTEGKAENGDVHMEEGEKPSEDKGAEEKTNGDVPASDSEKVDEAEKSTAVTEEKGEVKKSTDESKDEEMEATEKAKEKTEDSSEPPAQEADSSKPKADSEAPSKESEDAKPAEETEGAKPPSEETAAKKQPDEKDTKPPSEEAAASKEQPDEKDAKPSSEETASKEQPDEKDAKAEGEAEVEPMEGEEEAEGAESEDGEENEGTEEKENDEEEVGNLQLAWEMLDLSKVIFKRQQTKEAQLKAAQAHLKLGEVSIESENYGQAIEDFLACLNIQKEHLEEHDRLLAETHYQLGLAYQYSSKHDSAISHFTQSTEVIEKRVAMITEQIEKAAGESTEELQKEMDELKGLLPDIREKIEDSKEAQKTAEATEKALKETLAGGSSGFSQENGSTSAPAAPAEKTGDSTVPVTNCVSDISHLVRKKRKPEEESPLKDAKKSKAEPVENGSGNGDAVVPTNDEAEKAEEAEKPTPVETPVETPMETTAVESSA